jgi:hypothetical protein
MIEELALIFSHKVAQSSKPIQKECVCLEITNYKIQITNKAPV